MKITFDPAKRSRTFRERRLIDAAHVFAGRTLNLEDRRRDHGETRIQTAGYLAGRMVMIVWTPRGEARHIISMRKCNAKEQAYFQEQLETR